MNECVDSRVFFKFVKCVARLAVERREKDARTDAGGLNELICFYTMRA